MLAVRIVYGPIDVQEARSLVSSPENGALLFFEGVVRNHHEGRVVTGIDYEAYEEMARLELERIGREVLTQHAISSLAATHRVGQVAVGETSLLVAVGARHRRPAFEAALAFIDALKERVPIWKKEHGPTGSRWVEGVVPCSKGVQDGR